MRKREIFSTWKGRGESTNKDIKKEGEDQVWETKREWEKEVNLLQLDSSEVNLEQIQNKLPHIFF